MPEKILGAIEIRDFKGLAVSIDPNDVDKENSTVQKNVISHYGGKMKTRHGWKICVFEGE